MSLPPPLRPKPTSKSPHSRAERSRCLTSILDNATPGETDVFPVICFLLRHSTRPDTFLIDLGIHKDWDTLSPSWRAEINKAGADMLRFTLQLLAALGPFAHAIDFCGDGSLYVVDAPGNLV
ncbi:hypothetical protein LXA43DRAFT_1100381 [Ganoderma leucocontextum]|nr:hypothetical protein LXA43DRAFT_1100381 [Ganoderma leucocontextum]